MFNYMAGRGKSWLGEGFADKPYDDMNDSEKEIVRVLGFEPEDFKQMQLQNKREYIKLLA